VDTAESGQPAVEGDQEVEALRLADLPDDDAIGPHPQGLFDEAAEGDLPRPFEAGLSALHRDDVPIARRELEGLLHGDDAEGGIECRDERAEHGGLPCLRRPGHQQVGTGDHAGPQELRGLVTDRSGGDELTEVADPRGELADVDRHVAPGDVRDDDVQPGPVRQRRVDERVGQIDPTSGRSEHPFHEVADVALAEDDVGELRHPGTCHEHLGRLVDPDLLDARVVQQGLDRPEAGHRGEHLTRHAVLVVDERCGVVQRVLVVPTHLFTGDPPCSTAPARLTELLAHPVAHARRDDLSRCPHAAILTKTRHSPQKLSTAPRPEVSGTAR
jgi:hypothetical protein